MWQQFEQTVLVIGDVMIDRYLTGSVSRISPEAPVPVVLHRHTDNRLGGAANVALNVKALGGRPVLCSVVGADDESAVLLEAMRQQDLSTSGIVHSATRRTTVKTRVLGNHQQMLRIDAEDTHDLSATEARQLLEKLHELLDREPVNVIILQDYNKGTLSVEVVEAVLKVAAERKIFTAVDPKKANFFAYKGVNLFKPNLKEVRESAPFHIETTQDSLQNACNYIRKQLGNQYTMLTLSEKGLFLENGSGGKHYPTIARNISDVSGAGDTVISIAAMALAAGMDMDTVAHLSNLAGGQVCEVPGVVPVRLELLKKEWLQTNP